MAGSRVTWPLAWRAAAALFFGIMALSWPGVTVLALALLFGAYAFVDGGMLIADAVRHRGDRWHRVATAVAGGLGVMAGVLTLLWPQVTALVLVVLVGAWALVTGAGSCGQPFGCAGRCAMRGCWLSQVSRRLLRVC
ncbi:HdeD family acid-resistance protein [Streptomyces sp. NPDC003015]